MARKQLSLQVLERLRKGGKEKFKNTRVNSNCKEMEGVFDAKLDLECESLAEEKNL